MSVIDPIGDLLSRIRNASAAGRATLVLPHSRIKEQLLEILVDSGRITSVQITKEGSFKQLEVELRPGAVEELIRISKPGRRIYSSYRDIPRVRSGQGLVIVSTSKGLMTGEEAKKEKLGGELLVKVW